MGDSKDLDNKIFMLPEWSVWDMAINHHYEARAKPSKDFLYRLLILNKQQDIKISAIPVQLESALNSAFSDRKGALDFFLDQEFLSVEPLPRIFNTPQGHGTATLLLAYWKALSGYKEVYVVADNTQSISNIADDLESQKVSCKNMIISPTRALKELEKYYKPVSL